MELFEVDVVEVFEDEGWGHGDGVTDDVEEFDDVFASAEVLEDFDFSFDFSAADGF